MGRLMTDPTPDPIDPIEAIKERVELSKIDRDVELSEDDIDTLVADLEAEREAHAATREELHQTIVESNTAVARLQTEHAATRRENDRLVAAIKNMGVIVALNEPGLAVQLVLNAARQAVLLGGSDD
jgi:septal ring factor EnvC (AmiA/AmiB activator)